MPVTVIINKVPKVVKIEFFKNIIRSIALEGSLEDDLEE